MKIFSILNLCALIFYASDSCALTNSVVEALDYQKSEIKKAIGIEVKIEVRGEETQLAQSDRNLIYAINQIGSSIPYLCHDYFNKRWFEKNLKNITFLLDNGSNIVDLNFEAGSIKAKLNPNKETVVAGVQEIENKIRQWIPRLGPGPLWGKNHFEYLQKEFKTYLKRNIEVNIDWNSLENHPFESSEALVSIGKQVLEAMTRLGTTPAKMNFVKKFPERIVLKVDSSIKEVSYSWDKEYQMLIKASGTWLSSEAGKFYVLPNQVLEDLLSKP